MEYKFQSQNLVHKFHPFQNIHHFSLETLLFWWIEYGHQNVTLATKMRNFGQLLKKEFHCVIDILCILTQLFIYANFQNLKFIFVFINKILFFRQMLCLMDKNGNLCPSKNVTLATQHVLYLENNLVLMAQIFATFSFCKYV